MIRGAIEVANELVVQGWLYCSALPLRGTVVLAFVDASCVGSGKIDLFRSDLKQAGLGDGYSGFSIAVRLANPADAKSLVVRIESSDLTLLQKNASLRQNTTQAMRQKELA